MSKKRYSTIGTGVLVVVIYFAILFLVRQFFQYEISEFVVEIFAATVGTAVFIATTVLVIGFQSNKEREREHANKLFELKLAMYKDILETIFEADDDAIISKQEVQNIENKIGTACLCASEALVGQLSQFVYQLKTYGALYFRSMKIANRKDQRDHFRKKVEEERKKNFGESMLAQEKLNISKDCDISTDDALGKYFLSLDELVQGMREDLGVVEGNVKHNIGNFMNVAYDIEHIIDSPNVIG